MPKRPASELSTDTYGAANCTSAGLLGSLLSSSNMDAMMETTRQQQQQQCWHVDKSSRTQAVRVEPREFDCESQKAISDRIQVEQDFDGEDNQVSVFELCMNDTTWEERNLLMEVLGTPSHELGQLTVISRLDWSLPLKVITKVVKRANLLTTLNLYSVALLGDKHDFAEFSEVLRNHSSLKEIHLVDCCLVDETIPIDSLLLALADIPTLETVEIYAMDLEREARGSLMSPASLAALGSSKSIQTLTLEDLDLSDEHIKQLSEALLTNNVMRSLTLWDCNVTDAGGHTLAGMLKVNNCLEKFDLSYNDLRDSACKAIAKALYNNHTLRSLSLHGNSHIVAEKRGTGSGYDALIDLLKDHNHVIEDMILESGEDPYVSLYLTINRNRHLLEDESVSREKLVESFSEHKDHLSFVYFLLRTNPELCDVNR